MVINFGANLDESNGSKTEDPRTDPNHSAKDIKTMAAELAKAHVHIRLLESKLQGANSRVIHLENQNASGFGLQDSFYV